MVLKRLCCGTSFETGPSPNRILIRLQPDSPLPPTEITVSDVDAYIVHCQEQGRAIATINRRLAALSAFYRFCKSGKVF